jgi:predicted SnoaL-like aldol condensation-catalyzing enzyme
MAMSKRDGIKRLLKGIETGDPASVTVVNEARYVQHNPMTAEGSIGLAELFKRLAATEPQVHLLRMFEDGDYVFGHVEYDFAEVVTGFEVFRFEDGFAVEHWDNLQHMHGEPNPSGHTMNDGLTEVTDLDRTEQNRDLIAAYVEEVLIERDLDRLPAFVAEAGYTEHNPHRADGFESLQAALTVRTADQWLFSYEQCHRILAEGCFVLSACEGRYDGTHSALYDLFRIVDGKIVEHWDSIEPIPPRAEWKNENGKF